MELEEAREALALRNEELQLKKTLAQTLVHDLKNPLSAILGNLDLLEMRSSAELSYMGTRFIAAKESNAFDPYKKMVVDSDFSDLVLTNSFTGAHAYYLRPSIVAAGLDPDNLKAKSRMDLSGTQQEVKAWKDIWGSGQGIGSIKDSPSVQTLVSKLTSEFKEAVEDLNQKSTY